MQTYEPDTKTKQFCLKMFTLEASSANVRVGYAVETFRLMTKKGDKNLLKSSIFVAETYRSFVRY